MVFLEIQDQGKGLKPALLARLAQDWMGAPGVGLRGMNERMQQLGGRLELSSTAKGTTVTAIIPLVESSATPTEIYRNSRIVAAHPPPDNLKK